jgi:hypothetical protein
LGRGEEERGHSGSSDELPEQVGGEGPRLQLPLNEGDAVGKVGGPPMHGDGIEEASGFDPARGHAAALLGAVEEAGATGTSRLQTDERTVEKSEHCCSVASRERRREAL